MNGKTSKQTTAAKYRSVRTLTRLRPQPGRPMPKKGLDHHNKCGTDEPAGHPSGGSTDPTRGPIQRGGNMATIRSYVFARHVRVEASSMLAVFRSGRLVKQGRGLSAWF